MKWCKWSGQRDSNSRPRPWQGRALPTELCPHLLLVYTLFFFVATTDILKEWLGYLDSNQGMTESKSVALPLGYTPTMGRSMGIEPTNVGATIRCVNHFATTAIISGRGSRNRTHTGGFGDLCSTVKLCPYISLRENGGGGRIRTAEP